MHIAFASLSSNDFVFHACLTSSGHLIRAPPLHCLHFIKNSYILLINRSELTRSICLNHSKTIRYTPTLTFFLPKQILASIPHSSIQQFWSFCTYIVSTSSTHHITYFVSLPLSKPTFPLHMLLLVLLFLHSTPPSHKTINTISFAPKVFCSSPTPIFTFSNDTQTLLEHFSNYFKELHDLSVHPKFHLGCNLFPSHHNNFV